MKKVRINNIFLIVFVSAFTLLSLSMSIALCDVEWFQASGAIVTLGGVLLAARKIIRLGYEDFVRDERTLDGGTMDERTPEQLEASRQFDLDMQAYPQSIFLIITGTLIWAYGGILLRYLGI